MIMVYHQQPIIISAVIIIFQFQVGHIKLLIKTASSSTSGRLRIVGYDENKENPDVIANKVLVPANTVNTILSYTFTVDAEKYIRFSFRNFATLLEIEKL